MEVLALSELIDFKAGEVIFRENDPGDRMYIIRSGTVAIIKLINERSITITHMGPDDIFGEMALAENRHRSATVRALTDVSCQVIGGEVFRRKMSEVPAWMRDLYSLVVERLRVTTRKYSPHAGRIPGNQIVDLLSLLANENCAGEDNPVILSWDATIDRINYIFDIPERQARIVLDLLVDSSIANSDFHREEGRQLVVPSPVKLTRFAHFCQEWELGIHDNGSAETNAEADEYDYLLTISKVMDAVGGTHAVSLEKLRSRMRTRLGLSLDTYKRVMARLDGQGITTLNSEAETLEVNLDRCGERLADLRQNYEYPWLAGRLEAISQEIGDSAQALGTSVNKSSIVKGLTDPG